MRKIFAIMLVIAFAAVSMTGCDSVQRKFTRKKKAAAKVPRIYQVKKYEKKPTPELYKKHYSYWQAWNGELLQVLGDNHKKDKRCIDEIITNLKDMQNILVADKGKELDPHIARLEDVRDIIYRESLTQANKFSIMGTLEREDRYVKREFHYDKVKSFLRESFDSDNPETK